MNVNNFKISHNYVIDWDCMGCGEKNSLLTDLQSFVPFMFISEMNETFGKVVVNITDRDKFPESKHATQCSKCKKYYMWEVYENY